MLGSVISGGMGALGSIASGYFSKKSAKDQMAFQLYMDSTRYQRGMADMKKAGLNPILAYQGTAAGGAPGAPYQVPNVGEAATHSAKSGAESRERRAAADTQKTLSQLQEAQTRLAGTQEIASAAQAKRDLANERYLDAQTVKSGYEALVAEQNVATAKAEAALKSLEASRSARFGESRTAREIEGIMRTLQTGASSAKSVPKKIGDFFRSYLKSPDDLRRKD